MKKENTIKGEKGIFLVVATACMSEGVKEVASGNYAVGLSCIVVSIWLFFVREHYKFNRWRINKEENK